jgi:phytoene dehydrogenase-like protein
LLESTGIGGALLKGPPREFEVIVIGGGVGGLTVAAYLQKAGLKVALFERREEVGTMCATEELMIPGVRMNLHASMIIPHMGVAAADLGLGEFGFEPVTSSEWSQMHPFRDGSAVLLHICDARKQYEAWKRISPRDAEQYRRIINYLGPRWSDLLRLAIGSRPTPEVRAQLNELVSGIPGMPWDWPDMNGIEVSDLLFEDDRIKAALLAKSIATGISPWFRGVGSFAPINGLIGHLVNWHCKGGSHALPHALARCFVHHGGSLFQGCPVEKIIVDGGEAEGVFLSRNAVYPEAEFRATKAVVSNLTCVPTFLQLVGEDKLSPGVVAALKRFDYNGQILFTNYWIIREPIKWIAEKDFPEVSRAWAFYFGIEGIKDIERLGNDLAAGRLPDPPIVSGGSTQGYVMADPSQAPPGLLTLMTWSDVPYDLRREGGPEKWDDIREEYGDKVEDLLAEYAPNVKEVKLMRYINTPLDIYRRNPSAIKGGFFGGEVTPSQYWDTRPFPGCGAPRTPIHKLYISNSIWPPGGTFLTAGSVAAETVAEDLGVREQDWWMHKPLDEYPAMLAKYGWEWRPTVD